MKKAILILIAILSFYSAFAVDYYLDGYWFQLPTMILLSIITVTHITLAIKN
jgi:hypothetical protein